MIATSHAPVAAATVVVLGLGNNDPKSVATAIGVGLVLHLVQDSVAHTDASHFRSTPDDRLVHGRDQMLWWEMPFYATDVLIGLCIAAWAFRLTGSYAVLAGSVASMVPDYVYAPVIKNFYKKIPVINWYTTLHEKVHFPLRPSQRWYGILPQLLAVVLPIIWLRNHF